MAFCTACADIENLLAKIFVGFARCSQSMVEQGTDLELEDEAVQSLLTAEDDTGTETARKQLNAEELAELHELFRLIDSDGNAEIDKDEMVELLHSMSVRPSEAEINILFDELDWTKDGRITMDEFVTLMTEGAIHSVSREDVISAFRVRSLRHAHLKRLRRASGVRHGHIEETEPLQRCETARIAARTGLARVCRAI